MASTTRIATVVLFFCAAISAFGQSDAAKAFDKMKQLAGNWAGKTADGRAVSETFRVVSGGASLMSELNADEPMVSMFYVDGGRLMMTHFCPSKNQPRMTATISPDGNTITFDFLDATGLATPESGHMHRAIYILGGKDKLAEEWTWRENGKETREQFEMHRQP